MYWNYLQYKKRLDQVLDTLRGEYMGQNEKLMDHLPAAADMPPEVLADQLAHKLLFRLSLVTDLTDAEIGDSRRWLRSAVLFLLECCPEEDHIFGKLVTLAGTGSDALALLNFSGWPAHYGKDLANVPQVVRVGLEAAIWLLTQPQFPRLKQLEEATLKML